jgi:asparagine synthase (glutamine-hydrolysing)
MCGITGIFDPHGAPIDAARVQAMTDAIAHRGPDGSGRLLRPGIGLGHRRLGIIDLEGGAQPMGNEDGRVQVVFNGEIYNFVELRAELQTAGHVFRTRSDTEVIVHAWEQWGAACVTRFNGMFAFALWDERERRLFVARDHLGVKPLYWTVIGGQLVFASEVKALLAHPGCPRGVDLAALNELFTYRHVPAPRTLFAGIRKLPPGHALTAIGETLAIERWWTAVPMHRAMPDEDAIVDEYAARVFRATKLQMRSDVPVGLFLSSGVDSGALLAMMRETQPGPIHTFTIGFEGGGARNETDDARALARDYGAVHHERIVTAHDYAGYFDRYMDDLEEPVGNESAAAFHFVSGLAARDVKVVLTGQGADEPWAGYHRHLGIALSERWRGLPRALTDGVIRPLVMALPRNERLKRGVQSLGEPDLRERFLRVYAFFTPEMRERLFTAEVRADPGFALGAAHPRLSGLLRETGHLDDLSRMLYVDTRTSLPDDLLMVNDKMSMAHSIEARVPFLDPTLVEFIESLPPQAKLRFGRGKRLHKRALERWLPAEVVHRKKKGFDNPVTDWLRTTLRPQVHELLFSADAAVRRYFDMDEVRRLVADHESGREDRMLHVYLLVSFELWHRRFMGDSLLRFGAG